MQYFCMTYDVVVTPLSATKPLSSDILCILCFVSTAGLTRRAVTSAMASWTTPTTGAKQEKRPSSIGFSRSSKHEVIVVISFSQVHLSRGVTRRLDMWTRRGSFSAGGGGERRRCTLCARKFTRFMEVGGEQILVKVHLGAYSRANVCQQQQVFAGSAMAAAA